MSVSCQVAGCEEVRGKKGVKFFDFPRKNLERRGLWINALRLHGGHDGDRQLDDDAAICSKHFVSGRPKLTRSHPDYVPSIFPTAMASTEPRTGFSDVTEIYDVKYKARKGDSLKKTLIGFSSNSKLN